jgi:hypothetical protein
MRTLLFIPLAILFIAFTLPTVSLAADDDFGNLGELSTLIGGTGDLSSLLEQLPELIDIVTAGVANQSDTASYPVTSECLGELETIAWQLENDTKAYYVSDGCMEQLINTADQGDFDTIEPVAADDDQSDGTGDNTNGNGSDEEGVATECVESALFNADCSPKISFGEDDTVTFSDDADANTYKRTDDGTYVDTETGEEFTLAEVIEREGVDVDVADDHGGARSIIDNILNSANLANSNDPAAGAASNSSSAFGDLLSSLFGGSSGSGGNPITSMLGNIPGVSQMLGGSGTGSPGGSSGGTDTGNSGYSGFDGKASDFIGDIEIVNPDGPSDIIWQASKDITPLTMSVLEYVSKRVEFPLRVTSTYRPGDSGSQHSLKKAVDIGGRELDETQKAKVTQVILSHPEVGGYGHYPNDKSFHFDTREGKVYWSGPPGGPYIRANFDKYCSGGGGYTLPPMICSLVHDWASGKSVGTVIDEGAITKPLED